MAKENSFDIVSQVDMQEVDNAYQQTCKELVSRYDLKGSGATLELDKNQGIFTIVAPSDFVANQVRDVLETKLIRRQVDIKAVSWAAPQNASGGTVRVVGTVVSGISQDLAKKINKAIKDTKLKCKVTIEGDKLKVSSASRDTLQEVISFVKEQDYDVPLQFTNYR